MREPLVALCILLSAFNLLLPAMNFAAAAANDAPICYGLGTPASTSSEEGPAGDGHFASCCFCAAVALAPGLPIEALPRETLPDGGAPTVARTIEAQRLAASTRIRAPPAS